MFWKKKEKNIKLQRVCKKTVAHLFGNHDGIWRVFAIPTNNSKLIQGKEEYQSKEANERSSAATAVQQNRHFTRFYDDPTDLDERSEPRSRGFRASRLRPQAIRWPLGKLIPTKSSFLKQKENKNG